MPQFADPDLLHRVTQADAKLISGWREGVSLESRSGHSLTELQHRVTAERLALASGFLSRGRSLMAHDPPLYRDATSRFYYAAYHAFRALVYHETGGDDHEGHTALPTRIPKSFPQQSLWSNDLKSAREIRNAADYNLFPKSPAAWRNGCLEVKTTAEGAVTSVRSHLRSRGCQYI